MGRFILLKAIGQQVSIDNLGQSKVPQAARWYNCIRLGNYAGNIHIRPKMMQKFLGLILSLTAEKPRSLSYYNILFKP